MALKAANKGLSARVSDNRSLHGYCHDLSLQRNVESLVFFSDIFSWEDVIEQTDYKTGNFFDVLFRFECDDFEKLTNLLSQIPVSVTHFIELEHNYIFLPDEGFDEGTDNIYTLRISVHPCSAISKLGFRKQLNQYMAEINKSILCFLK